MPQEIIRSSIIRDFIKTKEENKNRFIDTKKSLVVTTGEGLRWGVK